MISFAFQALVALVCVFLFPQRFVPAAKRMDDER